MTVARLMFAFAFWSLQAALLGRAAEAQQVRDTARFYSGPVRVTQVRGVIELADGADPALRFDLGARNQAAKPDSARVAFRGGVAMRVTLSARDSARVTPLPVVRR